MRQPIGETHVLDPRPAIMHSASNGTPKGSSPKIWIGSLLVSRASAKPFPEVWVSAMQTVPSGKVEKFWCSRVWVEGIEAVTSKVCPKDLECKASLYLSCEKVGMGHKSAGETRETSASPALNVTFCIQWSVLAALIDPPIFVHWYRTALEHTQAISPWGFEVEMHLCSEAQLELRLPSLSFKNP